MSRAPRQGFRVREWQKGPGGKEFEQFEFTEFERPHDASAGAGREPMVGRQFAAYHENLRRNVEALS